MALLAPLLGAMADRTGARKRWVLAFSVPYVARLPRLLAGAARHGRPALVLAAYVLAFLGSEFGQIFTNAMLPGPRAAARDRAHLRLGLGARLSRRAGLAGRGAAFLAPAPGSDRTLLGIAPVFGLDPAAGEPARATGPLSALWYVVFALPLFLWTPDAPRRPARGALVAPASPTSRATLRQVARATAASSPSSIASMVYRDALAALFTFGGIYAAGVLGWGLFQLGVFGIVAAGVGTVGAWARRPRRPRLRAAAGDRRLDLVPDRGRAPSRC